MMDYEGRWYYFNKDGFQSLDLRLLMALNSTSMNHLVQKDIKLKANSLILIIKSTTLTKTMAVKSRTLPLS